MRANHPDRMVRLAVHGMLPKNTLSRMAERRLKVYAGSEHPHEAQNPQKVDWL
jgi:large subunit ribosomal protein L13